MSTVDFFCDKYIEMNFSAKAYEDLGYLDKNKPINMTEYVGYLAEKCKHPNYDSLESPFTEEEQAYREELWNEDDEW